MKYHNNDENHNIILKYDEILHIDEILSITIQTYHWQDISNRKSGCVSSLSYRILM